MFPISWYMSIDSSINCVAYHKCCIVHTHTCSMYYMCSTHVVCSSTYYMCSTFYTYYILVCSMLHVYILTYTCTCTTSQLYSYSHANRNQQTLHEQFWDHYTVLVSLCVSFHSWTY